jgi:hypothetical protein
MMAYSFVDENKQQALYWRDVGTLDAYYDANMDLCSVSPTFNLYDKSWPIRTRVRQYPPAKFVFGEPGRTGSAPSTQSSPPASSSPARRCRIRFFRRMCASTPTRTSTPASSSRT